MVLIDLTDCIFFLEFSIQFLFLWCCTYHINMLAQTDAASVGILHMVTVTGHFAFFSQNCDMSLKRDVRM
jgi:hypothetical protein